MEPETRATIAYGDRQQVIAQRSAAAVARLWLAMPGRDREDIDLFVNRAAPVVGAAQSASRSLSATYLTFLTGQRIADTGPLTQFPYPDPFIKYWKYLKDTGDQVQALEASAARASTIGHDIVIVEADEFTLRSAEQGDIVGWRRVLRSDSCDFCTTVARQRYKTKDTAARARHRNCDCLVVPIYGNKDPGQVINAQQLAETAT